MDSETNQNESGKVDIEPTKLTDWSNEPTVEDLRMDLNEAQSDHSAQVTKIERWLDNLFVRNGAKIKARPGRSTVQPKLIRKQAEWRYSSLSEPFLSNDNIFAVDPVTYEDKKQAEQNALVLNHQFNTKLKKVKFIGDYVRTAVDEGTVIVKIGWEFEERTIKRMVPEVSYFTTDDPSILENLQAIMQMEEENPHGFERELDEEVVVAYTQTKETGMPTWFEYSGEEIEIEETITIKNNPTLEICNYNNVIIDPTCLGDLTKASFIIYSFETSMSELKKEKGKYKNLDKINVQNNSILSAPDSYAAETTSFNFKDEPRKKILAYEYWGYWDIDGSGVTTPIVATFVGNTMIRLEENPFPSGFLPFEVVPYLPVRKSVYGEPDGELIEDNQKIVGAVTRGVIDIMGRSAAGQTGYRKDALDVTNRRKFISGEDYEYNPNVDPRQAFHTHTFPEIPNSAEYMLNTQANEAESLTGVKSFSSGISGQALGKTATGVRSALDATSKRDLDILRRLAAGLEGIGRKILAMNALFLSEEEVIRITNEDFVKVRRDDLKGNFDLRLTISTAEVDNQKAEELAFMLQTLGNSVDFGIVKMILADIAKLRKMPTLAKNIERYEPQPDPIAQERAMLELELLKAQIQETLASAEAKGSNAGLNQFKAGTEQAKQRNLTSAADKTDLDYVEQETGTKQERDLQKHRAQAEANMDLEVVKAMLNPKTNSAQ